MCKCAVSISHNEHKQNYASIKNHLDFTDSCEDVEPEVLKKMIELDTLYEVCFYPSTPIGSYVVYHYDLDKALDESLQFMKERE